MNQTTEQTGSAITEPQQFTIQPANIDPFKHFWGAFDHSETEISAEWLVSFAQQRARSWEPFTHADIEAYYCEQGQGRLRNFGFNRLIHPGSAFSAREGQHQKGGGWILERGGTLHFTYEFVLRCHRASPATAS